MDAQEQHLFIEIFPIQAGALPELTAYELRLTEGDPADIGGRLAYRLTQTLDGHWIFAHERLLTDIPPNPVKLIMAVDESKKDASGIYAALVSLEQDYDWRLDPMILADFVARARVQTLEKPLRTALAKTAFRLRNARVERDYRAAPWVVDDHPALSLSLVSQVIFDPDLNDYAKGLKKTNELVGLRVRDKTSTLQGEITRVVGKVADQRDRLGLLTQRDEMRAIIAAAAADELVVTVSTGKRDYDYVASALQVVIRLDDMRRFDIDSAQASKALQLPPTPRAQMIRAVSDVVKTAGLIDNAYSTKNLPEPFLQTDFNFSLIYAGNRTRPYRFDAVAADFSDCGMYWSRERFSAEPVRMGVINTLSDKVDDFFEAMRRVIESKYGYQIDVVRERKVRVVSQSNIESAVRVVQKETLDVVVAFCADQSGPDDEVDVDRYVKAQMVGRGLPCIVIHESTMNDPEKMETLIMAVLARAGNVPYLLDIPIDYADFIVGLSLIPDRKKDQDYLTGMTRIYRQDGALMFYIVAGAPVEPGEGIPEAVLSALFPKDVFAGKRALVHYDGVFTREQMWALGGWEDEIDMTVYPVEIATSGAPRLYMLEGGRIANPPFGSLFLLEEDEVLMATHPPVDDEMTQPLHVISDAAISMEQVVHSLQAFTLFDYGALKPPALPVTLKNADAIRAAILRGVLPDALNGDAPFWL